MTEIKYYNKEVKKLLSLRYPIGIILCGLPGSGKSTLAKEFEKKQFMILCKDTIRLKLASANNEEKAEAELNLESYNFCLGICTNSIVTGYNLHLAKASLKEAMNRVDKMMKSFFESYCVNHPLTKDFIANMTNLVHNNIKEIYDNLYPRGIVFDATHVTKKQRMAEINCVNNHMPLHAISYDTGLSEAVEAVKKRSETLTINANNKLDYGHFVPFESILNMQRRFALPSINEGFYSVAVISRDLEDKSAYKQFALNLMHENNLHTFIKEHMEEMNQCFPSLMKCIGFNQENSHHQLTLDQHIIGVAEKCKSNPIVFLSALLHDVGKIYTKEFTAKLIDAEQGINAGRKLVIVGHDENSYQLKNYDGKIYTINNDNLHVDKNAHYYGHEIVSAFIARRELKALGFSEAFVNRVYDLISLHMYLPFHVDKITKQQKQTIQDRLSFEDIKNLIELRIGDASSGKDLSEEDLNYFHSLCSLLIEY